MLFYIFYVYVALHWCIFPDYIPYLIASQTEKKLQMLQM